MKKVSIIIPSYNVGKYIATGIKSCINQSYSNVEIIVVDDGSTDNTSSVVKEFANIDKRVIYIYKPNGGVSSARNTAIQQASGEYLLFLDGDDWLELNAVKFLVDALKKNESFLIASTLYDVRYSGDGSISKEPLLSNGKEVVCLNRETVFESFGQQFRLQSSCYKLFDTNIVRDNGLYFDENISHGEDGLFVFEYLQHCDGLAYYDVPLWNILARENSATSAPYNSKFLTLVDAAECIIKKSTTSKQLHGAKSFFVFRIEGLLTVVLLNGVRTNINDIKYLRKKLKDKKEFVLSSDKNFFSVLKYFLYLYFPLYPLKTIIKIGGKIKKYRKRLRS